MSLQRFHDAQADADSGFEAALAEMRSGRKRKHWIWCIFPQLAGLGRSGIAQHYGIQDLEEACQYLRDPVLRFRYEEITAAVAARILDIGFNGFVFEDPEANHVANQNEQCWKTFWEPWAAKYGYKTVAETDPNNPPLGVHIEYYAWLFRTFDRLIQKHAKRLGATLRLPHLALSARPHRQRKQDPGGAADVAQNGG